MALLIPGLKPHVVTKPHTRLYHQKRSLEYIRVCFAIPAHVYDSETINFNQNGLFEALFILVSPLSTFYITNLGTRNRRFPECRGQSHGMMKHNFNLKFVLGAVSMCSFVGIQLALLFTALKIRSDRDTRSFSNLPNIATAFNCFVGTVYAILVRDGWLLLANFCGWCIAMYCVGIYSYYSPQRDALFLLNLIAQVVVATLGVYGKTNWVGTIMMVGALGMMASPLATITEVISMNSLESMPLPLSAACFLNGLSWCLYGALKNDLFIAIPNGLGAMCASVQLYVWALYCPYPEGGDYTANGTSRKKSWSAGSLRRQGSYLIVSDDEEDSGSEYSFDGEGGSESKRDSLVSPPASVRAKRLLSKVTEEGDTLDGTYEEAGAGLPLSARSWEGDYIEDGVHDDRGSFRPPGFGLQLARLSEVSRWSNASNASNISDLTWATSTKSRLSKFFPALGYGAAGGEVDEGGDEKEKKKDEMSI